VDILLALGNLGLESVRMLRNLVWKSVSCCVLLTFAACSMGAGAQEKKDSDKKKDQKLVVTGTPVTEAAEPPADSTTEGSVTVGGEKIAYRAVAGTLTVGSTDSQDAMLGMDGKMLPDSG
jgi:carboxypeptidase C (cathepsin A)